MTILARIRAAARELATLIGSELSVIDAWHGRPLEDLSEMEQLETLDRLNRAVETIRENRRAA